jgi:hypothetical protein
MAAVERVQEMAHEFWEKLSKDGRISDQFKEYLKKGNPIDFDSFRFGQRNT